MQLKLWVMQVVQIYFSTALYDRIENDVSVTLGDQLNAMILFAGFSILSAVEVLYFVMKFLFALTKKQGYKNKNLKRQQKL